MMWFLAIFFSAIFAQDCETECGHDEYSEIHTVVLGGQVTQILVCLPCPWNAIGSNETCICNPGYYEVNTIDLFHELDFDGYNDWFNIYGDAPSNSPNQVMDPSMYCAKCPTGAQCTAEGTTIENVLSNDGYFAGSDGENKEFYPCLNDHCLGDSQCDAGYTGLTCTQCEGDLVPIAGYECSDCKPSLWAVCSFLIDLTLFLAVFIYYYRRLNSCSNETRQRMQAEFIFLKILLSFMQVCALLLRFQFDMGNIIDYIAGSFKETTSTGFAYIEYGCGFKASAASMYVIKSLIAMSLPALLSIVWIGILVLLDKISGKNKAIQDLEKNSEEPIDYEPDLQDKVMAMGSLFFFYLYPFLAEQSGRVFTCVRLGNGPDDFFLADDLQLQCWSGAHWTLVFLIFIPMTAVYTVGVPLGVTFMIRTNKRNIECLAANQQIVIAADKTTSEEVKKAWLEITEELKEAHGEAWKEEAANMELRAQKYLTRWGWYFVGYKQNLTSWEDLVFARKLAMIMIACTFTSDEFLQAMAAIAVLMIAVALHERYKPICVPLLDDFELGSLIATLGLYFAGALTLGNHVTSELAQVACFVFGAAYGLFTVYIFLRFVQMELDNEINLDDIMGTSAADSDDVSANGANQVGCAIM